jgi:hypothetical protein
LCRILPQIKQHLVFPDDEALISNLEKVIRERLTQEKNVFDRQLIQQVRNYNQCVQEQARSQDFLTGGGAMTQSPKSTSYL